MATSSKPEANELQALQERLRQRELAVSQSEKQIEKREKEASARDQVFNETNVALLAREKNITHRETEAKKRQMEFESSEKRQAARAREVSAREGELTERERAVTEREVKADTGFATRNRTSLDQLEKQRDAFLQEFDRLQHELTDVRRQRCQGLEAELRTELETRRKEISLTLERAREQARSLLDQECTTVRDGLRREQEVLDQRRVEQVASRVEQEQKAQQLREKESELRSEQSMLIEDKQQHPRQIEERVREAVAESQRRIADRDRRIAQLGEDISRLQQAVDASEDLRQRFGGDPDQVRDKMRKLEADVGLLQKQLADRPSLETKEQLDTLLAEKEAWQEQRGRFAQEMGRLRAGETSWLLGVKQLEEQKSLREVAERHRDAIWAQTEKLSDDVNRLRSLYEQPKEITARIGVITEPYLRRRESTKKPLGEEEWLQSILAGCEASGLLFPKRLLYAFHTALKTAEWSPLAVLAGVSGTGKSLLPKAYARFGGLNYLPLSVQPNWDSPQSLFGFFNSVDNRFNATPLLQAMTQSQRDKNDKDGLKDQLLLVLLDEMNLAPVELYFSDLLSKLEDRRGETTDVAVEIDLGAGLKKHPVALGRNILWAGTMNEDENTHTLSDKVLDRGNVIVFPRPRDLRRRESATLAEPKLMLPREQWDSWSAKESTFTSEQIRPFKELLEVMNSSLEHVGRALGHRVFQSIEHYMANHPAVLCAQKNPDNNEVFEMAMRQAFEEQLVQKVMPKLRGIETSGKSSTKCLEEIRVQLASFQLNLDQDFNLACTSGHGGFVWRSAHYLEAGA